MTGACGMCSGTDCAEACAQGHCYAEEMQRQQEAENADLERQWQEEEARRSNCDQRLMVDP